MTGRQLRRWRTTFETPSGEVLTQPEAATWYGCHERTWRGFENGRYREGFIPTALDHLAKTTTHIVVNGKGFKRVG